MFWTNPFFYDMQAALFVAPAPLILVGGAGSGKTALLLEKLKTIPGDVLYITHSAYLAEHARELYYAHDFVREGQEAAFLSYRDCLETWRIPEGREASWRDLARGLRVSDKSASDPLIAKVISWWRR